MNTSYMEILLLLWGLHHAPVCKNMDLQTTYALNQALGSPDSAYPIIHVAGSNGKGSVTTKISNALQASGYRVGLYTSPHLSCFRERIRINGEMISENHIAALLRQAFDLCEQIGHTPSFFELTTCAALKYFADQKVDVAVLEVGLGGRLDSTNIVEPILSVITSISLEHTHILGNTREAIAAEKGGIIKTSVPVVVGPRAELPILRDLASKKNSPYIAIKGDYSTFDTENSTVAAEALRILSDTFTITPDAIQLGLQTRPQCRMELFQGEDLVALDPRYHAKGIILDVAHNNDGISRLIYSLGQCYPGVPISVACGFSKDKEITACLKQLADAFGPLHLISAAHDRALPITHLANAAKELSLQFTAYETVDAGVKKCLQDAKEKGGLALVCGSFFLMSEVRASLGIAQIADPFDLNEPKLLALR